MFEATIEKKVDLSSVYRFCKMILGACQPKFSILQFPILSDKRDKLDHF